ncbi:MAG: response regulator transcription factor [Ardenticatenaceae bacterium]|nr:response regulator transcription factor [Ardenticatenaceae bacterium]
MRARRLLLIDNHPQARRALLVHLARVPGIAVAGNTADADEAVSLATVLQPDIILLEPKRLDAIRLARQLREVTPDSRILVYTSYPDLSEKEALLGAGASAYLLKSVDLNTLWAFLADATPLEARPSSNGTRLSSSEPQTDPKR